MNNYISKLGKNFNNKFLGTFLVLSLIASGCNRKIVENSSPGISRENSALMAIPTAKSIKSIYGNINFNSTIIYNDEIVIYPSAWLSTTNTGRIIFNNRVTVIGQSQVFDGNANVEFGPMATGTLNPNWFGANGTDSRDDSKAIQKVLDVAKKMQNGVRIEFGIGRYYIQNPLSLESASSDRYPISLSGISSSYTGTSGSSLLWTGNPNQAMLVIRNMSNMIIENLDFNSNFPKYAKHNIELRPMVSQIEIRNCIFSGCAGEASSNINLNEGDNSQVSEIFFKNCTFRGILADTLSTPNAIRGGWANTKNFYFNACSIGAYREQAIKINTSDILAVENCTFFKNDVDINCSTCKTRLESNYSEASNAFFEGVPTANFNATTLINNSFNGIPTNGYVIRGGSGTLIMINNNFGAGDFSLFQNKVKWHDSEYSTIQSVGNVFTNVDSYEDLFINDANQPFIKTRISSHGDLGGSLQNRIELKPPN